MMLVVGARLVEVKVKIAKSGWHFHDFNALNQFLAVSRQRRGERVHKQRTFGFYGSRIGPVITESEDRVLAAIAALRNTKSQGAPQNLKQAVSNAKFVSAHFGGQLIIFVDHPPGSEPRAARPGRKVDGKRSRDWVDSDDEADDTSGEDK